MKSNKGHAVPSGHTISDASKKDRSFPIVAIGGSAGAFPAYEKFFTHMPVDSGMAFVIVTHLDPNHKGDISQLIRNYTQMPVFEAVDGMEVNPGHVYIIPHNKDMGIHNRKLLLLKVSKPKGYHQPIDYFLQSLADDQWNKAVGIILSGMGSDGETGVRMLKEKLGMVMVQDPQTALYSSMPLAAIGTNLADYVLSPEEMPVKLIQYLNHPILLEDPSEQVISEIRNENSVHKILMLLRSHTGHDFSQYKKSTIIRRIDRRIAYHQQPDYVHYVNFLRENPQEIDTLFNEMLIGVTKFFRDSFAFDSLYNKIMKVIGEKKDHDPVRVWIAGCSTGEEAYSVAMILIECVEQHTDKALKIQIFATDLDVEAIVHARSGFYRSNIVADVSEERIKRFFVKTDTGYTIKKELREMIVFAQHNLIKDAPFTRLDLLCCRNVMIYLTSELQKKIIPIFHYALKVNGLMLLGPAETVGGFPDLFSPVDPKWKIFERKSGDASLNKMIDFPFHVAKPALSMGQMGDQKKQLPRNLLADTFNKLLLEHFTPTCILINEQGEIQYTKGKTGRFLELPSGEVVMNVLKMAREEIRYVLSNIIHKARAEKGMVYVNDVRLREDGKVRLFNLQAMLLEDTHLNGYIFIVFEDKGLLKPEGADDAGYPQPNSATEDLEKELIYTKQQLSSTIEQMETSLEELKSTNEELQSTNEELQSTNEESLTTKEEMQSLNEELMTINAQYESKAEELSLLNNDMKNLLDATEIGTVFLNNELEILRYTPQVCKLFNVIPTDIGRPLAHVVPKFDYALEKKIKEVINSLQTQELELRTKTNEWYSVRIMPYRTLDNFISGAVLTFSVITEYKKMEFRLRNMQTYANEIIQIVPQPMIKLDADLTVQAVNREFLQTFRLEGKEIKGLSFEKLMQDYLGTAGLSTFTDQMRMSKEAVHTRLPGAAIAEEDYDLTSMPIIEQEMNEIEAIFVVIQKR
jgi:two-component system CheB/CheR fusion protein